MQPSRTGGLFEPPLRDTPYCMLVVDADPKVATMVNRHFDAFDIVGVERVEQLTEAIKIHQPQIVLWNVPPAKRSRLDNITPVSVPLIECSLPSQTWITEELEVAACLSKPITASELLAEIERLGHIHEVLIIDDNRGLCQLVTRILESAQQTFSLRCAYDGNDGLQAMHSQRPDLVLLDLIMPDLDGAQVLEAMRKTDLKDIPVILLTGTNFAEDLLIQHGSRIVINHPDGLYPAEVLDCLHAITNVLVPQPNP